MQLHKYQCLYVLERAGAKPFSQQVLKQQLHLLRKAALTEAGHPMRKDTFADSSLIPQIGRYVRRVGRPRQDWTTQLLREGAKRFGAARFQTLLTDCSHGADARWKLEVGRVFQVISQLPKLAIVALQYFYV